MQQLGQFFIDFYDPFYSGKDVFVEVKPKDDSGSIPRTFFSCLSCVSLTEPEQSKSLLGVDS